MFKKLILPLDYSNSSTLKVWIYHYDKIKLRTIINVNALFEKLFSFFFFVLIENSYELTKRMNNLSGRKIFYFFKVSDSFAWLGLSILISVNFHSSFTSKRLKEI